MFFVSLSILFMSIKLLPLLLLANNNILCAVLLTVISEPTDAVDVHKHQTHQDIQLV